MGQQPWTESLFYYFRLEEQIPGDHLLRLIDCYVDFSFVREQLKGFYSAMGRPSIDPEVLLRLLVVGYLYGITSERRLMEEVRMHLAYRWFTCLSFERHRRRSRFDPALPRYAWTVSSSFTPRRYLFMADGNVAQSAICLQRLTFVPQMGGILADAGDLAQQPSAEAGAGASSSERNKPLSSRLILGAVVESGWRFQLMAMTRRNCG